MPKIEFPAFFEHGLIGMKCTEDIAHREAFMYIPTKMILSVTKTQADPVLGPILEQYPEAFGQGKDQNEACYCLTLALFIYYQMSKGKQSYWYAYLRMLPDVDFSSGWKYDDFEYFQDPVLTSVMMGYNAKIGADWKIFHRVIKGHPEIFPARFHDEELFTNIYAQITTRIFGFGLESCCMIPMADNMNHANVTVEHEIINLGLHLDVQQNLNYHRTNKYMNDYTAGF